MALEIILNGRSTGMVGAFILRGGALFATRAELRDLGFIVPAGAAGGADPVGLSDVPGITARLDMRAQTLAVAAEDRARLPAQYGPGPSLHLAPLTQPGFGGALSFDLAATHSPGSLGGGGLLGARLFSPYGVLENNVLAQFAPGLDEREFTRLDSSFTYSDEDDLRRWRAGDLTSSALAWTRSVRLGGVQLARDFSLRPDLITYPYPSISSSAALPSSVDLFVNGLRQSTQAVQAGPFAIRSLPLVSGAGEITATATDALGRQTSTTVPLYVSTELLQPGLSSYSLEAGLARQEYGVESNAYAGWAGSFSLRHGVTDWLTLESHAEAAGDLGLVGMGANLRVFTWGILNAAIAGSVGDGKPPFGLLPGAVAAPPRGMMVSLGVQRQSRFFNVSLAGRVASPGYRDIAAVNGAPVPRSSLTASLGVPMGRWGTLGVAWIDQRGGTPTNAPARQERRHAASQPALPPDNAGLGADFAGGLSLPSAADFSIVTGSYSLRLTQNMGFYATAFADLGRHQNYGGVVGLTYYFGHNISASSDAAMQNGHAGFEFAASKPVFEQNDIGFSVNDTEAYGRQREGDIDDLSPYGYFSAGVADGGGMLGERAEWRGSIGYAGGTVAMGNEITDSFAVVRTGDVAGIPVLSQNRPYGTTDGRGTLLVPNLASYQNNSLEIDPTALPPDVELDRSHAVIRPSDRAGLLVDFGVRRVHAALLTLHGPDGKPIPAGATARIEGGAPQPVGFDGQAYLAGLLPHNRAEIILANGHRCSVQFDYRPTQGAIPAIGPLTCQ